MLDVCLLGTGGTMPLPNRFLTSLMLRLNGSMYLIDCGEGTQVSLKLLGWGFKQIDAICFTHFHADHISGLPGMLLAIATAGRYDPLIIIGPRGVKRVVESLRIIAPELTFPIEYYEIGDDGNEFCFNNMTIGTLPVEHRGACYAYKIEVERQGKFDVEKAKALGLPVKYWSVLQKGETVMLDGREYHPHMVLGDKRKGIRVCYATDLRPSYELAAFAKDADLLIAEGVYGDMDKKQKAARYKHTMIQESCEIAKLACVNELWLTHFSPSMANPKEYQNAAASIFKNAKIGYDRMSKSLIFED